MSCEKNISLAMLSDLSRCPNSARSRCGAPASFREASRGSRVRGSRARSGSRSTPASSRSCSDAGRRRPSPEVDLRAPMSLNLREDSIASEVAAFAWKSAAEQVDVCAVGFVHGILDDAVIDFAEDLVHDLDDSCLSPLNHKTPSHAMLVEKVAEPMISEFEEDEGDAWAAATLVTDLLTQQAAHDIVEKDSTDDTDSTTDLPTSDPYEDVYTWEGTDALEQDSADEVETTVYSEIAEAIAKHALDNGCETEQPPAMTEEQPQLQQELIQENVVSDIDQAQDFVCNLLDEAIGFAALCAWQSADGAEAAVDEPNVTVSLEAAKSYVDELDHDELLPEAAEEENPVHFKNCQDNGMDTNSVDTVQMLKDNLVTKISEAARTGRLDDIFVNLNFNRQTAYAEETEVTAKPVELGQSVVENTRVGVQDSRGKELSESANRAKQLQLQAREEMLQAVESGRLEKAVDDYKKNLKLARMKHLANETLMKAAKSGALEASLARVKKDTEIDELRSAARETLLQAATNGTMQAGLASVKKAKELAELRCVARETLAQAATSGTLATGLATIRKAKELSELQRAAKDTLLGAAATGKLEQVCEKVDKQEEQLKERARDALEKALDHIQLEEATFKKSQKEVSIAEIEDPEIEEIVDVEESPAFMVAPTSRPTSSKSKRRIIGAVSRTPASTLGDELSTSTSSSTGHSRRGHHSKKEHKEHKKELMQEAKEEGDFLTCKDLFDRPTSSKASARLRKAVSMSALAMDLGADVPTAREPTPRPPSYASPSLTSNTAASCPSPFAPVSFTPVPLEKSRSSSLASLRGSKPKASGLLPSITSKQTSTQSIEWSMGMSKASSKWSTIDLRGSRAAF